MRACRSILGRSLSVAFIAGVTAGALQLPAPGEWASHGGAVNKNNSSVRGVERSFNHHVNRAGKGDRMLVVPSTRRPADGRQREEKAPGPPVERSVKDRLPIGCEWGRCLTDAGAPGRDYV